VAANLTDVSELLCPACAGVNPVSITAPGFLLRSSAPGGPPFPVACARRVKMPVCKSPFHVGFASAGPDSEQIVEVTMACDWHGLEGLARGERRPA
jgi:hypothetical protein